MPNKIRILLAHSHPDSLASIRKLIEPFKEFKITAIAKNGEEAFDTVVNFQPDIVIMATSLSGSSNGFETTMRITRVAPYIGVILVGTSESVEVIHKAMQAGAGDFLKLPINGNSLRTAILSLYTIKQEQRRHFVENPLLVPKRQPKVIAVFSSKGGVGKTVLATNISIALRELTREEVLLMDLDLQFGDVTDLLNLIPKSSIIELINEKGNIEQSEIRKYLLEHESGLYVLAAPQQPEQADFVNGDDIKDLIVLFKKEFDYIVIDLPPLFNEVTLGSIEAADHVLLITTMEIPTLKNIKSGLDILKRLEYAEEKTILVLNRYDEQREINSGDIRKFLGINEITLIDDRPEIVSTSINMGEPLILKNRESSIAKQIINLSKKMIEYIRIVNPSEKRLFFRKLRKRK